jgi:hypothetical protein
LTSGESARGLSGATGELTQTLQGGRVLVGIDALRPDGLRFFERGDRCRDPTFVCLDERATGQPRRQARLVVNLASHRHHLLQQLTRLGRR